MFPVFLSIQSISVVIFLAVAASSPLLVCCSIIIVFTPRNLEKTELPVYSVKAHKEIINCINGVGGAGVGEGAPEIVTGSRDGRYDPSLAGILSSSEVTLSVIRHKILVNQNLC